MQCSLGGMCGLVLGKGQGSLVPDAKWPNRRPFEDALHRLFQTVTPQVFPIADVSIINIVFVYRCKQEKLILVCLHQGEFGTFD